jgi:hypothetical protein
MDATYSINSKVIFDDILYNIEYKSTSSPITVDGYISYPGKHGTWIFLVYFGTLV